MAGPEEPYANWSQPATKGDLVRAAAFVQSAIVSSAALAVALRTKDDTEFAEAWSKFTKQIEDLNRLINEIGGRVADGQ